MELRGTLDRWNDDKGFGFIRPEQGGEGLFVHISAVRGDTRPQAGDSVMYIAGKDEQGRPRATHMRHAGLSLDRPAIRRKPRAKPATPVSAAPSKPVKVARLRRAVRDEGPIQGLPLKCIIFLLLCVLPVWGSISALSQGVVWLLMAYPLMSVFSFCQYWYDKQQAQKGDWRVPENTLHLVELLGGWPGALLAQQVFRHKTRKQSYQVMFWLIVCLHQAFWVEQLLLQGRYLGRWFS